MTSIGSTVVENLTSDPKFEDLNLDIGIGRDKMAKIYNNMSSIGSTVVEHSMSDPKYEGSNLDMVEINTKMTSIGTQL